MLKKYSSKSCVSISVMLSTGGSTHISFTPRTGGGSVFYTDNETIQEGLKKHPKYGRLFKEEEIVIPAGKPQGAGVPSADASGMVAAGAEATGTETQGGSEEGVKLKTLDFSCNDDAKDYLAEKYGVSRSAMRTRSAIEAVAKDKGVVINWTE